MRRRGRRKNLENGSPLGRQVFFGYGLNLGGRDREEFCEVGIDQLRCAVQNFILSQQLSAMQRTLQGCDTFRAQQRARAL